MLCPPALLPGARVAVIAPSGPFDKERVRAGIAWLEERYDVRRSPDLFDRDQGFLAGSDEARRSELQEALDDPTLSAIVAARGGYGVTRLLGALEWTRFVAAPRWIVGFSDVTALHVQAARRGIASLHAMNVSSLGDADAQTRAEWLFALENPAALRQHDDLRTLRPGEASGPLFGGNLTLLFAEAASGRLALPDGCILVLEDVTETSYRVDRMLTALGDGGYLARASAIVLGDFTDCSPGKHGVLVEAVLEERLAGLGIPVVSGLPVGHGARNVPLHLGFHAHLNAQQDGAAQLVIDASAGP